MGDCTAELQRHADAGFNGDGKTTLGFGDLEGAEAVAMQPDGKIVVVGVGTGRTVARWRVSHRLALDSSFDNGQLYNSELLQSAVRERQNLTLGKHQSPNGDFKLACSA
jgi:hypothetical protein